MSPPGLQLLRVQRDTYSHTLERMSEIVVLLSLFTAGLKSSPALRDSR